MKDKKKWQIEIYTKHRKLWMFFYDFQKHQSRSGTYFKITASRRQRDRILSKADKKGLRYHCYEKQWARSTNYRTQFFRENDPPYRCLYCHRKLKEKDVCVDHIVPVGKVKHNEGRLLLYLRGITNVNDIRNLAASCHQCNARKSDHLGIWYVKAVLGRFRIYWMARRALVLIFLFFLVKFILNFYNH
jgi:5-methylcytosine-specific restriction endonuclease McrA